MSPIWANQIQDTFVGDRPHKHQVAGCRYPGPRRTMGTLFEPAFGAFPGVDLYTSKSFTSFGPPVDFEAGFARSEQWINEERHHKDETPLSSGTPGMLVPFYLENSL
jgi:hypothetical protein